MDPIHKVVFFDIGETLGSIRSDRHGVDDFLDVYPFIFDVLSTLRDLHARCGIISNTGDLNKSDVDDLLSRSNILKYFDSDLLIYSSTVGLKKDTPEIFHLAARTAGEDPSACLFIGEDSWERLQASRAGMAVCPHPLLAPEVILGRGVHYVLIEIGNGLPQLAAHLRRLRIVPLHMMGTGNGMRLLALATAAACAELAMAQVEVQALPGAPSISDIYQLRDDVASRTGYLSFEGQSAGMFAGPESPPLFLASSPQGMLVALPAGQSVENIHFAEALHGHNLKLTPDLGLLPAFDAFRKDAPAWLGSSLAPVGTDLSDREGSVLAGITDERIKSHLSGLTGAEPLDHGGALIASRHIHSDDNACVVEALAQRLAAIDARIEVRLHPFTHEGRRLHNVEGTLGPATSDESVLITAHLDSTAASSRPYNASSDQAPGADDDASGIAGVLATAEALSTLSAERLLRRQVRFVLFNAEEHGLVGSNAYARASAAKAEAIVAVLQMDMIGYNRATPRSWEIHAGYWPLPDVQARSLMLAKHVAGLCSRVSPELAEPQIYESRGPGPDDRDPAEERSDHAPFQERGYAACVASEDFFAGPDPTSPPLEANPDYHKKTDTFIDPAYAADIARVMAAAAWTLART